MADIAVTAASVKPGASAVTKNGIAGEAISAGQSVFKAADQTIQLCENDQAAIDAACVGVALNDAAVDQPVSYAVTGEITFNAVLAAGQVYIVGAAPGGIAPEADAVAGEFVTVVGVGLSTTSMKMGLLQSGVAHA